VLDIEPPAKRLKVVGPPQPFAPNDATTEVTELDVDHIWGEHSLFSVESSGQFDAQRHFLEVWNITLDSSAGSNKRGEDAPIYTCMKRIYSGRLMHYSP
jgi:hypothetical protein